jgi:STE24 endopeptidase
MGKAKRIVFFDTLIERLNPQEIEAVLAHELGHYICPFVDYCRVIKTKANKF